MTKAQVEKFIQALNDAWLAEDYPALTSLYDPRVVLLPPDAGEPIEGSDAVCASYRDFHSLCSVERFAITDLSSWRFGADQSGATKVHMRFEIDYLMNDTPHREQGLEVYTLLHENQKPPRIIWRAQFTL